MKTSLDAKEQILKQGAANFLSGAKSFGGKLYLTNLRLVFEPHVLNPRCDTIIVPIGDISTIAKRWTKVLNLIPLVPNSLALATSQGREYRFVLFGRDLWASAITSATAGNHPPGTL